MTPNTNLTKRVAVVTGAARGVGLALALHAADRGMMVALTDIDGHMLAAAVEQVRAKNVKAIAVHTDMLDFAAVRELARRTAAELDPPWLVCNNPGVSIDVNLWGVINAVQAFALGMVERREGHMVNIRSSESRSMHDARCADNRPVTRRDCRGGFRSCRHTALLDLCPHTCRLSNCPPVAGGRERPERGIRPLRPVFPNCVMDTGQR